MTADSIFRIASITKPITAAATMVLVERGVLGLDDAVDQWLPELAEPKVLRDPSGPLDDVVPADRAITVRDLLTLRGGTGSRPTSCRPWAGHCRSGCTRGRHDRSWCRRPRSGWRGWGSSRWCTSRVRDGPTTSGPTSSACSWLGREDVTGAAVGGGDLRAARDDVHRVLDRRGGASDVATTSAGEDGFELVDPPEGSGRPRPRSSRVPVGWSPPRTTGLPSRRCCSRAVARC